MPKHDPVPVRRPPGAPVEEPIRNRHAWARYRRVMTWMTVLAVACSAIALVWLRAAGGPIHIHMMIAAGLGVFCTVMTGTGLMSLVFLSAGTGHDAQAGAQFERD